ncbi:hypothetical protein [Streptomyces rubellomurinus]|uniref:hypothetical protein n=1 Tax=Streptomyces rubellomurinus (strain ATCC 31215) TaxID=359131 RepID=UPI000696054A|nr:hypothetical protein [Streptomyces rubellomurinus]
MIDNTRNGREVMFELTKLLSCFGPTCGDVVDWGAVEAAYGRRLPSDYQQFMAAFGCGSIEQALYIHAPAITSDELAGNVVSALPAGILAGSAEDWRDPAQAGLYHLEDMLLWGITEEDFLCWVTSDENPDRWPVAVYSRCHAAWSVYPYGMVEFLLRLFRDGFDEWPISDMGLRSISEPRFLHDTDEEAGWELQERPWE